MQFTQQEGNQANLELEMESRVTEDWLYKWQIGYLKALETRNVRQITVSTGVILTHRGCGQNLGLI